MGLKSTNLYFLLNLYTTHIINNSLLKTLVSLSPCGLLPGLELISSKPINSASGCSDYFLRAYNLV